MWSNGGNSAFSVEGMYTVSTFAQDGAPNDIHLHQQNYAASMDEVKEVVGEASRCDATFGHTLSGNLNMVSKNGTNDLHGTLRTSYEDQRWRPLNYSNRVTYIAVPFEQSNENSAAC